MPSNEKGTKLKKFPKRRIRVLETNRNYGYWEWHSQDHSGLPQNAEPVLANPDMLMEANKSEQIKKHLKIEAMRTVLKSGVVQLTPREWQALHHVILHGLTLMEAGNEMNMSFQRVAALVEQVTKRLAVYRKDFEAEYDKLLETNAGTLARYERNRKDF